ncbi:MAG: hypothetical protein IKP40_05820 [Clostridia bacterium]|nr:hypothetical protein [Clostridia bacterium]
MTKRDILKIAVIAAMLVLAVSVFARVGNMHESEETELVRQAVKDAALTCYAVEGAYPDSVDYLREHYSLAYDESRYYITYEAFASNRIPDIWVTEKGKGIK